MLFEQDDEDKIVVQLRRNLSLPRSLELRWCHSSDHQAPCSKLICCDALAARDDYEEEEDEENLESFLDCEGDDGGIGGVKRRWQ